MQVPTRDELMEPILSALRRLGGSASIDELAQEVIEALDLPDDIVQIPHGTGSRSETEYQMAWARTYLKKFGLIVNSQRGVWSLTPKGAELDEEVDSSEVMRFVHQETRRRPSKGEPAGDDGEITEIDEDSRDETATWREDLLNAVLEMDPKAFERLCQRLLRESGFIEVQVTGRSGDGGIDGHGIIRLGGLIGFPVLFQCKRYRSNVGPNVVRDFRGAMMGRAEKGLLITTGGFTKEARQEATRDGVPPIDLINGDLLVAKLKELQLGVRTSMVEVVEVDRDWYRSI